MKTPNVVRNIDPRSINYIMFFHMRVNMFCQFDKKCCLAWYHCKIDGMNCNTHVYFGKVELEFLIGILAPRSDFLIDGGIVADLALHYLQWIRYFRGHG